MRYSLKQILSAVGGLAALLIILEHAGGFSKILTQGASAFSTGYEALTGHGGGGRGVNIG